MISFKLYREHGALNSGPVFDAFAAGVARTGNCVVTSNEDVAVIWSALWHGRMLANQQVYNQMRLQNRPVIILEVGNLIRGTTWRIGINHINCNGYFGNTNNLDHNRPAKLGLTLSDNVIRNRSILITGQHERSLQWQGQPTTQLWIDKLVRDIRLISDLPIVFRPHPRASYVSINKLSNVIIDQPKKLNNTYDDYNFNYNHHCIINFNSGPGVQSVIHGTPVICDISSLAYPVSNQLSELDNLVIPDRTEWLTQLCHTEWNISEIASGMPLARLLSELTNQIC